VAPPLDGVFLKLKRAQEHIKAFGEESRPVLGQSLLPTRLSR